MTPMMNHQAKLAMMLVLTVAVMMLTSCTSPQITRRYASATLPDEPTGHDVVTLSLFAMDVPVASAQTTLLSLGERAQAALIRELSAKVNDAPSLLHALASPIAKPASQQGILDRTVVDRRVVMSIDNRAFSPATRIHKAATILSLKETTADFTRWSQFATKYQTVNLGSVKFTQASEFSLGVKAALPQIPASPEVTGSATATRSLEENLNINQRFVEATGVLTAKEARLVQEGASGIDLTGNMIVDLTVSVASADDHGEADIFTFTKLFDGSGKPSAPGAIEMDRKKVIYVLPRVCKPVEATAVLEATVRKALRGHRTIIEGDDKALYEQVTTTSPPFELVPAQALRFSVWYLVDSRNNPIHLQKDTPPKSEVLQFESWDEANEFLRYLRALPGDSPFSVKSRALLLRDKPLRKSDLQGLQAEIQRLNWENSDCGPKGPLQEIKLQGADLR
jgi:hypothetical protein